jgi:hypothetical protein
MGATIEIVLRIYIDIVCPAVGVLILLLLPPEHAHRGSVPSGYKHAVIRIVIHRPHQYSQRKTNNTSIL